METGNVDSKEAREPKTDTGKPPYQEPAWVYPALYVLPVLFWLGISTISGMVVFQIFQILWLAIFLGFGLGTAFAAFWLFFMHGEETLVEVNVAAFVNVIFLAILMFVFHGAHKKALHNQQRASEVSPATKAK